MPSPSREPSQTCIGRNPIDWPPKRIVPPSSPVRKRNAGEVSAAASATWSRS